MLFSTRSNDSQGLSWKGPIFYQYKDIYYSKLCHLVAKLCLTLCNPMDCSLPGSSVLGILQAKLLEWVAIPVSKGCSQPRNQTWIFRVSCTGKRIFYHWSTRDSVPFLCLVQCTLSANNCLSPHVTKKCIVQLLLEKDFIWLRSYNRQKKKRRSKRRPLLDYWIPSNLMTVCFTERAKDKEEVVTKKKFFLSWFLKR